MSKPSNDSRRVLGYRLMAKECTLSTGSLPSVSMSRHNVVRINDRCDIASAVYSERETTKHTNTPFMMSVLSRQCQCSQTYVSAVTLKYISNYLHCIVIMYLPFMF